MHLFVWSTRHDARSPFTWSANLGPGPSNQVLAKPSAALHYPDPRSTRGTVTQIFSHEPPRWAQESWCGDSHKQCHSCNATLAGLLGALRRKTHASPTLINAQDSQKVDPANGHSSVPTASDFAISFGHLEDLTILLIPYHIYFSDTKPLAAKVQTYSKNALGRSMSPTEPGRVQCDHASFAHIKSRLLPTCNIIPQLHATLGIANPVSDSLVNGPPRPINSVDCMKHQSQGKTSCISFPRDGRDQSRRSKMKTTINWKCN